MYLWLVTFVGVPFDTRSVIFTIIPVSLIGNYSTIDKKCMPFVVFVYRFGYKTKIGQCYLFMQISHNSIQWLVESYYPFIPIPQTGTR